MTDLRAQIARVLLGSSATFRNHHRNWLYLGFIGVVVVLIAVVRCGAGATP